LKTPRDNRQYAEDKDTKSAIETWVSNTKKWIRENPDLEEVAAIQSDDDDDEDEDKDESDDGEKEES
jgi:hypothetical protein